MKLLFIQKKVLSIKALQNYFQLNNYPSRLGRLETVLDFIYLKFFV